MSSDEAAWARRILAQLSDRSKDLRNVSIEGLWSLLADAGDQEEQQWLIRRAIQVWRMQTEMARRPWEVEHVFLTLFRDYWPVLPRPEAAALVGEMIRKIISKRDESTFGHVQDVEFKSLQCLKLFEIYDLIEQLLPEQAQQLVRKKRELARAVKRYPRGMKTIREEVRASCLPETPDVPSPTPSAGVVMFAGREEREYALALLTAQNTQDYGDVVRSARAAYTRDNGPDARNCAPKAFWPSTAMCRSIFHSMGRSAASNSEHILNQVPDRELRVLSQIELAAGMCDLPELMWTTQRFPC